MLRYNVGTLHFEKKKGRKLNMHEHIKSQQPVKDNIITA